MPEDLPSFLSELRRRIPAESSPQMWLETNFSVEETRPMRQAVPIEECEEPLVDLRHPGLFYYQPHVYQSVGAPYGMASPYSLRQEAAERLFAAAEILLHRDANLRLKVFDGYRPLAVQEYMVEYHIRQLARERGINPDCLTALEREPLESEVLQLFAKPSRDPGCPPPHSTGGAVDVTVCDGNGWEVAMGSPIDAMPPEALPSHYDWPKNDAEKEYRRNRELLLDVMSSAGFERLHREWWHFSYGDQYWAAMRSLTSGTLVTALYGAIELMRRSC